MQFLGMREGKLQLALFLQTISWLDFEFDLFPRRGGIARRGFEAAKPVTSLFERLDDLVTD